MCVCVCGACAGVRVQVCVWIGDVCIICVDRVLVFVGGMLNGSLASFVRASSSWQHPTHVALPSALGVHPLTPLLCPAILHPPTHPIRLSFRPWTTSTRRRRMPPPPLRRPGPSFSRTPVCCIFFGFLLLLLRWIEDGERERGVGWLVLLCGVAIVLPRFWVFRARRPTFC